jgi:hypothetical protein
VQGLRGPSGVAGARGVQGLPGPTGVAGATGIVDPFFISIKPFITYSSPVNMEVGQSYTLIPSIVGYLPFLTDAVYSSSPPLPPGLEINANTGEISVIAYDVLPESVFTITALTTLNYEVTFPLTLTIEDPNSLLE